MYSLHTVFLRVKFHSNAYLLGQHATRDHFRRRVVVVSPLIHNSTGDKRNLFLKDKTYDYTLLSFCPHFVKWIFNAHFYQNLTLYDHVITSISLHFFAIDQFGY